MCIPRVRNIFAWALHKHADSTSPNIYNKTIFETVQLMYGFRFCAECATQRTDHIIVFAKLESAAGSVFGCGLFALSRQRLSLYVCVCACTLFKCPSRKVNQSVRCRITEARCDIKHSHRHWIYYIFAVKRLNPRPHPLANDLLIREVFSPLNTHTHTRPRVQPFMPLQTLPMYTVSWYGES